MAVRAMGLKILVTGAAGFIGYHCARTLAAGGHRIAGVDNLNSYYLPSLKHARVAELAHTGSVEFTRLDVCDRSALHALAAAFRPDAVLHLAAQVGVRYSLRDPDAYVQSNVAGTLNVLECCRELGIPRLVYASSSSVYGRNTKLPYAESDAADRPASLYAATKRATELMAHAYTDLFGIQTIGLRFFTVYGPWGRPDMAVWLFTEAIHAGRPIQLFNQGEMFRDFTYVDDIVAGVKAALVAEDLGPCEVINLGNHRSEPLASVVAIIEKALGRTADRRLLPMQAGDVVATYADGTRSASVLGFTPRTSIADGIPRFVEWYLAHPEFHSREMA
jgi:UDP-glucuronate 4-epimerase